MNYLVAEFTGLGDFIQKTPMIRCIKELDDEAKVLVVGDNRWGGLDATRGSELIDEVCNVAELVNLEFPKGFTNGSLEKLYSRLTRKQEKEVYKWLNNAKWDFFFQNYSDGVPKNIYSLIKRSQCGRVVRHVDVTEFGNLRLKEWLRCREEWKNDVVLVPRLRGRHNIDSNIDLFEACRDRPIERSYATSVSIDAKQSALKKWSLGKAGYICLQPGGASGAATPKIWHPKNFVDLSRLLINDLGKKVVLVGDVGDNENIISQFQWPEEVINTAGDTSLDDLGSLLTHAAAVVVHDSGVMHIANALKVPLVALYGPTDFTRTRPLAKTSKLLFSRTSALGIMYRSRKSEKALAKEFPDYQAMSGISVNEVKNAIVEMIKESWYE